jgi:TRAP-type C4-dicarboxylate transport system permease small subunit
MAAVRLADRVVTIAALAAGYALLAQAILTAVEIVARKLLNFSFQGVDELGGYGLAITASLGFGFATLHRAHTRVDILLRVLSPPIRACLHVMASTVLLAIAICMLWYSQSSLGETLLYGSIANSPLQTPLWIPQTLWLAGFVVFVISAAIMAYRAASLLFRGEITTLDREFGPPTLDDEISPFEEPSDIGRTSRDG